MAQRPTFLTIICILIALYGILMLLAGILIIAGGSFLEDNGIDTGGLFTIAGGVMLIVGIVALIAFFLLKNGNKIGWFLAMIFLILNAISGILAFPAGLLTLVITVLLIWYFLRPNVREFFGI
ncbi:MAG: hypothetical protein FWG58_02190 [Methanomassiliicoccaceae archaeon]|nr:hypothetical protein [Methanomassiliicoccaceae archaeon]